MTDYNPYSYRALRLVEKREPPRTDRVLFRRYAGVELWVVVSLMGAWWLWWSLPDKTPMPCDAECEADEVVDFGAR